MVSISPSYRLLLRAELSHGESTIVAHTVEISESGVLVETDEPAFIGDEVSVEFSFPGLVEPFSLTAEVLDQQRPSGPGNRGQWTLGFEARADEHSDRLRALLARIQPPRPAMTPEESGPHGVAPPRYRLLLVEDNQMTRDAFAHVVQTLFGQSTPRVLVDIAANGQSAWEMLHGTEYDLAIVDYYLPLLCGDRLIARIRRDPRLAQLPVFAISVGGDEARVATLAAGADLFLPKPVVLRDLFTTLDQLTFVREQPAAPITRAH